MPVQTLPPRFQSERNTNRLPMSTAPKGGGGGAGARPPVEHGGASTDPPAPGRAMATGDASSIILSDPRGGGGGSGTGVNETPIDMTETDEEDNTTSNYVNGKRRRGGVGARRPATSTASTTTASSSAPAPAIADTESNNSSVSAQPQPSVEAAPAPAAGANKPTESRLLGPIDVDAIVFGPGGLHHDPEADERERLARERRLHEQQQRQQSASAAAGNGTSMPMSRPRVAASTSNGSANAMDKKSNMASNGGSNQGVVAAAAATVSGGAKAPGITAGVATLATASGQPIKNVSSASNSSSDSGSIQVKSKGATFNTKPKSSAVQGQSKMETTAPAASVSDPSKVRPSITDAGTAKPSDEGSASRSGVNSTAGAMVVKGSAHGDKSVGTMAMRVDAIITSTSTANHKQPTVVGEGSGEMSSGEEKKSDDDIALKAVGSAHDSPEGTTSTVSATPKQAKSRRKTMKSVLMKRTKGQEHDESAIDACADFIQTQLMTKNCLSINSSSSTKCSCIKSLNPSLVRSVATYVATTWCSMKDEEKINKILSWRKEKTAGPLPFSLSIASSDLVVEPPRVCSNGLAEVMGISHSLWRRAVQFEVELKKKEEAGVAILEEAFAFIDARGSEAVDACADFIRSYLMKKNCTDRSLGTGTSCSCIKDLDEALILPAAAYIVSTWGEMSRNEKAKQLAVWISNQASDALPFVLPIEVDPLDGSQPHSNKMICRNALIELLCIPLPMWKKAYDRVVKAAIPAAATHSSQSMVPIASATGSWMATGTSMGHPDVNSSVFCPMVGNPAMWAQFHAQAMASVHLATSLAQQQTAGRESSAVGIQSQDDSAITTGMRDEIPTGDMVPRQESQPISGDKGQQSAIIPVEKRWRCDKCQHRVFDSFDAARLHEETCSGIPEAADMDGTSGQLRQSARELAESQMSASKPASVTSDEPKPALSTPSQGKSQGAIAAESAPNPPTSNDDVKYLCDKCKIAEFISFDDACRHESTCVGATPEGEKSPAMAFTPRKATDEEMVADAAATFEPAILTNLATLCKQERWADVANLISANPLLSSAFFTTGNHGKTGILHQVIASSGDTNGRAGLVRSILTARPSAATIKNGYGSLPIHVLLQCNVNMKAKLKEELLRGLIHAYPASISIAGGDKERTPLHILLTDHMSANLCRLMLTLRPEAAKMRDKKGRLPIHIACSRQCSIENLRLLIDAYPESIRKTTNDEKTPLMLARSTATKNHPNMMLIKELTKRLGAGTDAATDSKLPAQQEAKSCENTAAEGLLAVSSPPKQEASAKKEKRKPTMQEEEDVLSDPFFIGQDVWVKCGVDLQAEHEAMVVSSGKADNTKITIRWTIAGYDQTVDIGQVRAMYSTANLDKPERNASIKSTPAPSAKRVGERRSSTRPPGTNQCGSCDACMVDDCGKCKSCQDMARFGGPNKSRRKCLHRPLCTVRCSSTKDSKKTPAEHGSTRSKVNTPASTTAKSTSSAAVAREYKPPDIRVGMEIMRYFADGGGDKSYFEGTLKRLPISSSPYYFIVYTDGDKEEISELDFWNAYSDYRVQKGLIEPSEFVPESLVVANDGRLAVVRSFRPVSNGTDTTWSYRVRFNGFSAKHDKWMLEVDLRKQTPATLKWAERVREAVKKQSSGAAKKSASVGLMTPSPSKHKQKVQPSTRPKATGKSPRDNEGYSYSLRRSGTSNESSAPMAKRVKTSSSQETAASDTSSIRHSRRAAAADAKAAMAKTAGPTRLKKGKSPSPSKDVANDTGTTNNDTLPEIDVGTRILKYFKGGNVNKYYQGKITKLPGPGNSFYHIRYFDGDQEDIEPNEMWKAFSDWCVANGELTLTKFDPDQQVYAVDCLGVPREATILSFRPVEKEGSNKWTWSYLVHFTGWNSRHDDWIDEINIYKATTANNKWAEQIQDEVERRGQRGSQSNSSSRSSSPTPSSSRSSAGDSRKRERAADNSKGNSHQKEGWQCDRCDEMNESNLIRCSGCSCWKDGKMPRRRGSRQDKESLIEKETVDDDDEDSVASDVFEDGWSCPICNKQHGPDALTCSGTCKGIRLCLALGCTETCEKDCDGMCSSHYQEAVEASEAIYGKDDDVDGGDNSDVAMDVDDSAKSTSAVSKAPNPTDETREESPNTTEIAGDDPNKESGVGAATEADEMAGGNSDKTSSVEGSSGDSGTARDDDNSADPSKSPDADDGKMSAEGDAAPAGASAAAASSTGSVGAPGESGVPNDGVDVSSPQPTAASAAASTPTRPTGRTPNLKNVMAALREVDSDDDGDFDEVFGYFGAGL